MTSISNIHSGINSLLSFRPLISVLKKMVTDGKPGAKKLYQALIEEIEATGELMQPMNDTAALQKHTELVETLLSTIFPPSTSKTQGLYAVIYPFRLEAIYASKDFRNIFIGETNGIDVPDKKTNVDIGKASISLAYNVILQKLYAQQVPLAATSVHAFTDAESGLKKYYALKLNAQFVDVKPLNDFQLPKDVSTEITLNPDELREKLPLEKFCFEGIVVIDVTDVTQDQVVNEIKTILLNINAFSDAVIYDELQEHVQSLIGLKGVTIGISPIFKKNDFYLYTEIHQRSSILFRKETVSSQKDKISELCQQMFQNTNTPVLFESVQQTRGKFKELLRYYADKDAASLILCPLKCEDGELIGLLEIMSKEEGRFSQQHLLLIQPAIQLFTIALEKTYESLDMQIDKTIKEHFTAIQPAVEWKFTEAAFYFLQQRLVNEAPKMPNISFEEVHPLYGAIDIRNSSVERNTAIQLDLLEQLTLAQEILTKASRMIDFPLLHETLFRIEKYIASASETLLTDDEMQIYEFLQNHLDCLLHNLLHLKPELAGLLKDYFSQLDPQRKIIFHHRKEYEESMSRINDALDRFIDKEQATAQAIFPHYFERYITDGVEFNIYIGQSLSPRRPFNEMFVKNLKLWQLSFLARAARLTHSLEKRLILPLQTTQLILAQAIPISISFRRKERKFDVDGAYNIRYEIVKKRIDKVHIRDSEERLTQPGTIAIVYTQQKELAEYLEYIEFLQHEKLLTENVEHLDLEDTQGISGLKAIRVQVDFESEVKPPVTESFMKYPRHQTLHK